MPTPMTIGRLVALLMDLPAGQGIDDYVVTVWIEDEAINVLDLPYDMDADEKFIAFKTEAHT